MLIENYYSEYKDLWENILDPFKSKSQILALPEPKKEEMRAIIYDELMSAIIRMMQRLSLQHVVVGPNDKPDQAPQQKPQVRSHLTVFLLFLDSPALLGRTAYR